MPVAGSHQRPLRIVIVHDALPRPDVNGSDVCFMQTIKELVLQGHELTYVARHGAGGEKYILPLQRLGIKVFSHDLEHLRQFGLDAAPAWRFEAVLKQGGFDLAILFHWFWVWLSVPEQYLDEIRHYSPQTRIAVLTYDQHGLRERRLAQLSGHWTNFERARDFEQREFEVYRRADMVLAVSESDRQGILAAARELDVEILPMVAEGASTGPEFARRDHVLFLGNFLNATSLEGLNWLIKEVWPGVVGSLPRAQLHLAGHCLPQGLEGERIVALGYVEDLDAAFAQHRLFVSPIRFCTGIQTKVLSALARGLPVVTTPAGAEGLNLRHEKEVLVAATALDFAEQVKRAYGDEHLWRRLSQDGAGFVKSQFSRERLATQIRRFTEHVRQLEPKPHNARQACSVLSVEREFPEVLTRPAGERVPLRLRGYCTLAELLLAAGDPGAALAQLRHVLGFVRSGNPRDAFFARLLLTFDRCYRQLGTTPPTAFVSEASECLASAPCPSPISETVEGGVGSGAQLHGAPAPKRRGTQGTASPVRKEGKGGGSAQPQISVVIPTFNRCAVLASCLAALEQQSLAKDRFEVIVVDDGSSDGTERLCQGLRMPFPLVYLRQANAGAGAARKVGTEAARGEHLLLFNDDTIATPNLLAEHLRVQREHAHDKCAVLGHFRYPRHSSKRALTSFFATRRFLFPQAFLEPGLYR